MKMKCLIFTGGAPICGNSFCKEDIEGRFVIAADSGCAQLDILEDSGILVCPDILLGDMDSYSKDKAVAKYPDAEFMSFPPEKDYTDTQLAIHVAVEKGFDDITVIGGTGNRADHYLANLSLLRKYSYDGITLTIDDGKNRIVYCNNGKITVKNDGRYKYFSLLPDGTSLYGVTIKGAKYNLDNADVDRDIPITVSNEIKDQECEITVKEGNFFFILCSD
ncbi:MAG: thiamine diphosphokinase [Ruminococcaceae bacterium]|nr:thiamine diphosphokinase [Oscillospiraceae bacterium]